MALGEFLRGALGSGGAEALLKAGDRHPALADVIGPRAVVAWVRAQVALADALSVEIPGLPGSSMELRKSGDAWSGHVRGAGAAHEFTDRSLLHAAAAVMQALGVSSGGGQVPEETLFRLGTDLDLLAKAAAVRRARKAPQPALTTPDEESSMGKGEVNGIAAPKAPQAPQAAASKAPTGTKQAAAKGVQPVPQAPKPRATMPKKAPTTIR